MSNGTEPLRSGEAVENPGQFESHVACSVCHQEIPVSAALWRESSDYVAHFCGLQCFDRWRNQRSGM